MPSKAESNNLATSVYWQSQYVVAQRNKNPKDIKIILSTKRKKAKNITVMSPLKIGRYLWKRGGKIDAKRGA
jgi:hypothetical protein